MTAQDAALTHDPDKHRRPYPRRPDRDLPFDPAAIPPVLPIMPDTNFYILRLQRRLPMEILAFAEDRMVLHSAVSLSEISITAGLLDPAHPRTAAVNGPLLSLLHEIGLSDCRAPSSAAWTEAGMLAGILARTQLDLARPKNSLSAAEDCCQQGRRRKLLNDALTFLTAREQGAVLLSSNVADMDLLLRFRPDTRVLLYRQAANIQSTR